MFGFSFRAHEEVLIDSLRSFVAGTTAMNWKQQQCWDNRYNEANEDQQAISAYECS